MKSIRNLFSILIMAVAAVVLAPKVSAARPAAKSVIESTTKKLREMSSFTARFRVVQGNQTGEGTLTVSGNSYTMSTPELKVWYDGKTQWTYSPAAKEVNISEPTAGEVAESNPLAVLTSLTRSYTCRRLNSSSTSDKIELVPTVKTDLSKVVITINTSTGLPTEILAYRANGAVTKVEIPDIKAGKKLPATSFRFNQKQYPGVEIVDLR